MPDPAAPIERKLAAIFAADVAGYSRLMGQDEVGTMRTLTEHREVMDSLIAQHRGRIANTAGDSVLAEFPSVVEAVKCAVEVQERLRQKNEGVREERQLSFRIGVHVGDVMVRGGDLLGDGVNVAARLQALSEPGGVCVSGEAHQYARRSLPLTFTDLGVQAVKNLSDGIHAYAVESAAAPRALSHSPQPLPLPDSPSIAVLPFTNMSGDAEQEYFADGVVEEIITALYRFKWLFVIARNSSFTYKGRAVDVTQVGRELGVRYVLEGSVRRSGDRVRITGQLIEAASGHHVWADRFDGSLNDVFDLQDRMTENVVAAIEPKVREAELGRSRLKATSSLTAYDLYLQALFKHHREAEEDTSAALRLLQRAINVDQRFALAYAISASCYAQRIYNNWASDPASEARKGAELAWAAVELQGDEAEVLWRCAHALAHFGAASSQYMPLAERAVHLNPNSAPALSQSAWVQIYGSNYDIAVVRLQRAIRLSPVDPLRFAFMSGLGFAWLFLENFEEALRWGREGVSVNPKSLTGLRLLAAAAAKSGLQQEAQDTVKRILDMNPQVRISNLSPAITGTSNSRVYVEGLRSAGLPE